MSSIVCAFLLPRPVWERVGERGKSCRHLALHRSALSIPSV
jgi:hypothetical protein